MFRCSIVNGRDGRVFRECVCVCVCELISITSLIPSPTLRMTYNKINSSLVLFVRYLFRSRYTRREPVMLTKHMQRVFQRGNM